MKQTFDQYIKSIVKQGKSLEDELQDQLEKVADRLRVRTRIQATIDPKYRTGRLYNSIRSQVGKARHAGKYDVILKSGNSQAFYAKYVEFGTRRIYPRLFMGKSMEKEKKNLPEHLRALLGKVLREQHGR